jgi:DNA processing protein
MNRDLKFLNAWNSIPNIGPVTIRVLREHFGSLEEAWRAGEADLVSAGLGPQKIQSVNWKRPSIHPDRGIEKLLRDNIWILTDDDPLFPLPLKEIPSPPFFLYGKGDVRKLSTKSVMLGVVGTRRPTPYGIEATEILVRELVEAGIIIVSGLAWGIDAKAHETTLEENGTTIAVLGSGLDQASIFPPENKGLAKRVVEKGGVMISEYAPETPATKDHFPARNRIIAGLSQGVVVVEAREKSGALITARLALEQNREVFALPGSIFSSTSRGPNQLIQQGAKLVQSAQDILEELGIEYTGKEQRSFSFGEKEKLIYELLEESLSVDTIKQKTSLETSVIIATLSFLELKGLIKNLGQDTYQRIS